MLKNFLFLIISDEKGIAWGNVILVFLIILLSGNYMYLSYASLNTPQNGVTHIRTKDTNVSTKIEQNIKPNPKYYGIKIQRYLV